MAKFKIKNRFSHLNFIRFFMEVIKPFLEDLAKPQFAKSYICVAFLESERI